VLSHTPVPPTCAADDRDSSDAAAGLAPDRYAVWTTPSVRWQSGSSGFLVLGFLDQLEDFFLEFDQLLGDLRTPVQTADLTLQLVDPAIARVSHFASWRLRLQAIQTTLGMLFTPTGKLGGIQAVAT
jgi:hypothetical protein